MGIKDQVQQAIKEAMKNKSTARLECLRLAKATLLLKEKESPEALTNETAIAIMRGEVRKRRQSIEIFREHEKESEALDAEEEIAVLEEFLPKQLSLEDLEKKVLAYVDAHPEINHPGKLSGIMKQELGDLADGKAVNEVCLKVLG